VEFQVALQAYTVRNELAGDYLGTLTRIAEIGYEGVELGPPPADISLDQLKHHLEQIGLRVVGSHGGLQQLSDDLGTQVDYLHTMGGRFLGLSHRFASRQDVLDAARRFNEIGAACRKEGIQFLYHNHNWEFTRFDGESAYDLLLDATDPELVKMELDTYWVQRAGEDPVAYLNRLCDRCPLLHIKDMEAGEEQFFAEVGEGVLDWDAIFREAEAAGTEWLVVEQDQCRRPALESITISYRNVRKMGIT